MKSVGILLATDEVVSYLNQDKGLYGAGLENCLVKIFSEKLKRDIWTVVMVTGEQKRLLIKENNISNELSICIASKLDIPVLSKVQDNEFQGNELNYFDGVLCVGPIEK